MTKTDENRVLYLLDCCDDNGFLSIDATDMALILEYQRELGRAEGRSELHEILQDIVYAQSMINRSVSRLNSLLFRSKKKGEQT